MINKGLQYNIMPNLPTFLTAFVLTSLFSVALAGDPCGPAAVVDDPNYPNTCNAPVQPVYSPSPYGVNCTTSYPINSESSIVYSNCTAVAINSICQKLNSPHSTNGRWIWTMYAERCALGFFLPPFRGSAPIPSVEKCETEIFTPMINSCSKFSMEVSTGSVNVAALPNFTFSGAAVNVGYPSYMISTETIKPNDWS